MSDYDWHEVIRTIATTPDNELAQERAIAHAEGLERTARRLADRLAADGCPPIGEFDGDCTGCECEDETRAACWLAWAESR